MTGPDVLIVEDELITVELIRETLENRGFNVVGDASNAPDALAMIEKDRPDLVLMDIRIKGVVDGIDLAKTVTETHRIPVIFLTAFADRKTVERAKMINSYGYIIKPVSEMELLTNIEIALHKHRLDSKLKEGEKRYRILFETMSDAICIHGGDGRIVDVNPSMERLTGYSRHELLAMNSRDLHKNEKEWRELHDRLVAHGSVKNMHAAFLRRDGGTAHCVITAYRAPGIGRGMDLLYCFARDLTDLRETHRMLDEETAFTRAVIESMPAIFFAVDREGLFVRWNRKLEELSGLTGEMIRNAGLLDIMDEKSRGLFRRKLDESFESGEVTKWFTLVLRGEGNAPREFMITGRHVEIGGKGYLVGVGVEVSE